MTAFTINPELFSTLIEDHQAKFPGAFVNISKCKFEAKSLSFSSGIFSPDSWSYGIEHNDPMLEHMWIDQIGEDEYVAKLKGGCLTIKATEEDKKSHYLYSDVKCKFRKTTGNLEKVLKAIQIWQEKRLALVKEYKDQIPNIDNSNLKDI